jgi:uncharacterized protein (TIGR02145 family)
MKTSLFIIINLIFSVLGCSKTTEPKLDPLVLNLEPTHVSIYGGSDGSIDLTITGGAKPYQYQWSNGETTEDISNIIAGAYSVTVTDANAETITDSAKITQPDETITVTDFDDNVYKTVKIGDQWWMAENLKVVHTPDGSPLESILYNNDATYLEEYGRLYTWTTAINGSTTAGAQGIAPDGWHIPSKEEWEELISHLGGYNIAGGKLKEAGYEHWNEPNTGADNSSGFTAVGSGTLWRGVFYSLNEIAYF